MIWRRITPNWSADGGLIGAVGARTTVTVRRSGVPISDRSTAPAGTAMAVMSRGTTVLKS